MDQERMGKLLALAREQRQGRPMDTGAWWAEQILQAMLEARPYSAMNLAEVAAQLLDVVPVVRSETPTEPGAAP